MDNKEIVGYIPKLLFKVYLYLKNKFDPQRPVLEEEIISFEICKKLISDQNSKLTISPLSNKRYIKNDEQKMFVVIENRVITIINHVYRYNVYFERDEYYTQIVQMIDNEVEKKRIELEEEIKSNIEFSLKKILNKLNEGSKDNFFN
jgi:hypothetical protein